MQLTDSDDWGATWSPDGKQIAYSTRMGGRGVFELLLLMWTGKIKGD